MYHLFFKERVVNGFQLSLKGFGVQIIGFYLFGIPWNFVYILGNARVHFIWENARVGSL